MLATVKDLLHPFRKRIDFDFNAVNSKLEELLVEADQIYF